MTGPLAEELTLDDLVRQLQRVVVEPYEMMRRPWLPHEEGKALVERYVQQRLAALTPAPPTTQVATYDACHKFEGKNEVVQRGWRCIHCGVEVRSRVCWPNGQGVFPANDPIVGQPCPAKMLAR